MEIKLWPALRYAPWLLNILKDRWATEYWGNIFDQTYTRGLHVDYWDYQWKFACWAQKSLGVLPMVNLVENIGFGADASHTRSTNDVRSNVSTREMAFPLQHAPQVVQDLQSDRLVSELIQLGRPRPQPSRLYRRFYTKLSTALLKINPMVFS